MQVEYATDLVFRSQAVLKPLYEQLSRQAVLTVKAEHVASFLGHKITAQLAQEIGSRFATRIEGTCVKHRFGKSSIKIYDKFALVLRIETTTSDVSAFKHYRVVEHREGPATRALAPVRKTIYSLTDLREILRGCNRRYLEYLSSLDDFSAGIRHSTALPNHVPSTAVESAGLTFSAAPNRTYSPPCSVPASTSPASAAPTSCQCLASVLPLPSPGSSLACATSASSNASPAPIATILLAPAVPPSLPAGASANTLLFLHWPDKICSHGANTWIISY